jgi:ribosomal protein S18 acetylase RimI-like enzyme
MTDATATLERAGLADVSTLVDLMTEFYAESAYELDRRWASRSFELLLRDASKGVAWIARESEEPAGHAVLTLRHSMEFGGLCGVIDDLFVRPRFRRQGIGTALMSAVLETCRALYLIAVQVEVDPKNAAAVGLYRAFGLTDHGAGRQTLMARLQGEGGPAKAR